MDVSLYPHQLEALPKMHNGCILKGAVGTGKSRVGLAYYIKACNGSVKINGFGETKWMFDNRDLYIITTAKKRDQKEWEDECAPFGLSTERDVSFSNVKVTIDSWNNISNYKGVKDGFFIFDEQRLIGSGEWVKAFIKIAAGNRWIILSATPGDTWLDYIPVFIAHGWYKNRTEFLKRHVVYSNFTKFPKVDHYVETRVLEHRRRKVLVEMHLDRHTTRRVANTLVDFNAELYAMVTKQRWNIYEDRPLYNVSELRAVARKVVNSDPSRVGAILKLLEKHPRLIVFYNFNYELDILRNLADTIGIPKGEWNGHRHEEIPDTSKWLYLVQYTAGAEGWNCTSTDAMAFWSLNYSYKINEQAMGRIERLNTEYSDLHYYILRSSADIDRQITKTLAVKKDFNENKYWSRVWDNSTERG